MVFWDGYDLCGFPEVCLGLVDLYGNVKMMTFGLALHFPFGHVVSRKAGHLLLLCLVLTSAFLVHILVEIKEKEASVDQKSLKSNLATCFQPRLDIVAQR